MVAFPAVSLPVAFAIMLPASCESSHPIAPKIPSPTLALGADYGALHSEEGLVALLVRLYGALADILDLRGY